MKTIKDSHIALSSTHDIQEICKPLASNLGITAFCYHKIFPDGKELLLSNDPIWAKHALENNLASDADTINSVDFQNLKALLWPDTNKLKFYSDLRKIWDCGHGIAIANGKNEYFGFCIKHNKEFNVINIYLNNIDYLEKFAQNFTEKAGKIISIASQNTILKFEKKQNPIKEIPRILQSNKFIEKTQPTIYLSNTSAKIKFTTRELECLRLLIKGYTNLEASTNLGISKRTIETHLENIKDKTGMNRKNELIKFIFTNNIDKYL